MKNNKYYILIVFGLFIVMALFVGINVKYNKDNRIGNSQTTKKSDIENLDYKVDKIMLEGLEEKIKVVKYNSHLGFSLLYDVEKFSPSLLSNGTVEFTYYKDNKVKLKIEKLTEKDYYEKYQISNSEEFINKTKYSYKYLRKNDSYYRLITIIPDSLEYSDMKLRIDYIIDNFYID